MRRLCFLLLLMTFLASAKISFAQDLVIAISEAPRVAYELPYPGLLPDNPLYFLRILRDKTVSFLISDPLKKSEFNLLQADKRLNAGIFLEKKGKTALAISTISKAENYFDEAIQKLDEAKRQGLNIDEMVKRIKDSSAKHKEQIDILLQKVSKEFKPGIQREVDRLLDFQKRLSR